MKILVVDDEKKIANVLAARLELRGYDAIPVYDGISAISRLNRDAFDAVILDLRMPDIDGIEVLERIKEDFPSTCVIVVSGHANDREFKTCLNLGAVACFHKPANISDIINVLEDRR